MLGDRIAVMYGGSSRSRSDRADADIGTIGLMMAGAPAARRIALHDRHGGGIGEARSSAHGAGRRARSTAPDDAARALLNACVAVALALCVTAIADPRSPARIRFLAYWALVKGVHRLAGTPRVRAQQEHALYPCRGRRGPVLPCQGDQYRGGGPDRASAASAATWIALDLQVPSPGRADRGRAGCGRRLAVLAGLALAAVIRLKRGRARGAVHAAAQLRRRAAGERGAAWGDGGAWSRVPAIAACSSRSAWLPKLLPGNGPARRHPARGVWPWPGHVLLWRTTFGFRLRVLGGSSAGWQLCRSSCATLHPVGDGPGRRACRASRAASRSSACTTG